LAKKALKFAICGYGGAFSMGRAHSNQLQATGRAKLVAVCDPDASRLATAEQEFPGIGTYKTLAELLKESDAEMVIIITPHNTHAPLGMQSLKAGRHVIMEKPFCITSAEGRAMVNAAKARGLTLSCYHNRRWDGDFLTVRKLVEKDALGDVFSVKCHMNGFGMRTDWWRASKKVSGGCLYDWGAHIIDWTLQLVDSKVQNVTGFSQKRVWMEATNEDEARALIRFANGAVGDVMISSIRHSVDRPKWEIMGTEGALTSMWRDDHVKHITQRRGRTVIEHVPNEKSQQEKYYANVIKHILDGEELIVTGEQSARVIAVLEGQAKSAKTGKPVMIVGG
jgi:predicted dehydrogenase